MKNNSEKLAFVLVGLALCIDQLVESGYSKLKITASDARNVRAETLYHFTKANDAQNAMFEAERNDDVDGYDKWLAVMRREDRKMRECEEKYDEYRDYLEAKIRTGELRIDGFNNHYEKDVGASILDHITGRAKY